MDSSIPRREAAAGSGEYLYNQLIPYLGNKRKLLPLIAEAARVARAGQDAGAGELFVDYFAGSGVVSRWAKRAGYAVIANDWEPYAAAINGCFVACDRAPEFAALGGAHAALAALNALPPASGGYVERTLCPADDARADPARERMFFTRANGARIDAVRQQIADWRGAGLLGDAEQCYLLAPLLFAASYASNTSGVFKGYHHGWGGRTGTALHRILADLRLRAPVLWPGTSGDDGGDAAGPACAAWRMDAQAAAERCRAEGRRAAVAYLDPPYNQHPYGSNYHLLNTIALWDCPPVEQGVRRGAKSAIRTDWRVERRSAYNHAATAAAALGRLLASIDARHILVSYSTDGLIPLRELTALAARRGRLECVTRAYKRYRVSRQRMSAKPVNAEFVLIIDAQDAPDPGRGELVADRVLAAEGAALAAHASAPRY